MTVTRVRGNAPVPTLALCPPPTLPPPSPALAAEVLAEARVRGQDPARLAGVAYRLWLLVSRAKREALERSDNTRVVAGVLIVWPDGLETVVELRGV